MPTTVYNESNVSILQHQLAQEQQCTNGIDNFSAGNSLSPRSSNSSDSSSSYYPGESNSPMRSPDTTTEDYSGGPYLQILEEPNDKFRFRYKTEMQGAHGAILGINAQKNKSNKTFPKVKLCNYTSRNVGKDPIIRCSLYTADENVDKRVAHVHRLIGKYNGDEKEDPHDNLVFSPNYIAVFKNMTILFTKKEDQEKVLMEKKQTHIKRRFTDQRQFKVVDEFKLRMEISEELSNMNLNVACLRFDALIDNGRGMYTPLCPPVYSKPINNMKNAQTNELRICRIHRCSGSCLGGDEVFMFVEKVVKKNIKVKFYEEGPNKEIVWSDYAMFTPDDVHHQYGIAFRTPPYRDPNITNDVEVYFQLERPSDKAVSDPMIFEYHPNPNRRREISRKRQRLDSSSNLPTMLNDFIEKPRIWNQETVPKTHGAVVNIPSMQATNGLHDNMADFSDIIKDLIQNPMDIQEGFTEEFSNLTSCDWSFEKAFGNIPVADDEAVTQFLNSGRMHEYAMLNGEQEAANMLMREHVPLAAGDLVFDGFKKLLMQSKVSQQPSNMDNTCSTKTFDQESRHNSFKPDNGFRTKLTESSIVQKTEKALDNFLKLKQRRKINEKMFQTILRRLFSYTVQQTEDSVLHVLAASSQSTVPIQAARFINLLKMFNVISDVIDSLNFKQETPLHVAASCGSVEMVSLLLEAGANVDATDLMHNTSLHLAILRDSETVEIVAALLSRNPSLSITNMDGINACHLAVFKRKPDILSSLLTKSEQIEEYMCSEDILNRQDRKEGNTILHIAVKNRFQEVVNLLLNLGDKIDVNAKNFDGKTPLAFVLGDNDPVSKDITDQLLNKKADPTLVDSKKEEIKEDYEVESEIDETDNLAASSLEDLSMCGNEEKFKNDYKVESDLDISDVEEEHVNEKELKYIREWGDECNLFNGDTISKICPRLDEDNKWEILFERLGYSPSEIQFARTYWSPSLCSFKIAMLEKPEITTEMVRGKMMMDPELHREVEHIDQMMLNRLGIDL